MAGMLDIFEDEDGPYLRVMADAADDPLTTPADAYGKFRFNSSTARLTYVRQLFQIELSLTTFPAPAGAFADNIYYLPPGSNDSNCLVKIRSYRQATGTGSAAVILSWCVNWTRVTGESFPLFTERADQNGMARQTVQNTAWSEQGQPTGWYRSWYPFLAQFVKEVGDGVAYADSGDPNVINSIFRVPVSDAFVGWYSSGYIQPYSTGDFTASYLIFNLPMDETEAWPADGTPVSGDIMLRIDDNGLRIARPGASADTASDDELILGGAVAAHCVAAGSISALAVSATADIDLPVPITATSRVRLIAAETSEGVFYMPPNTGPAWVTRDSDIQVSRTLLDSGSTLRLTNTGDVPVDLRYMVYLNDAVEPSSDGTLWEAGDDYDRFYGPDGAVQFDTRFAYPSLVADGWIPIGDFVATTGAANINALGARNASVSWSNDGTWKPFPVWSVLRGTGGARKATGMEAWEVWGGGSGHARQSAMSSLTDTGITFYLNPGARFGTYYDSNHPLSGWTLRDIAGLADDEPIGVRYYVFAIPNSV